MLDRDKYDGINVQQCSPDAPGARKFLSIFPNMGPVANGMTIQFVGGVFLTNDEDVIAVLKRLESRTNQVMEDKTFNVTQEQAAQVKAEEAKQPAQVLSTESLLPKAVTQEIVAETANSAASQQVPAEDAAAKLAAALALRP